MMKYNVILLMLILLIGCSNQPTNNEILSLEEYDDGLNLKVIPSLTTSSYNITFDLPKAGDFELIMMNATGYTVKAWGGFVEAGTHSLDWDLTNNKGKSVKEGIYIYELSFDKYSSRKVIVLREDS